MGCTAQELPGSKGTGGSSKEIEVNMRAIGVVARVAVPVLTVALAGYFAAGCGAASIRKPVDLSEAKLTADHDPIVIDGRITTPGEWQGAATVRFPKQGRVIFLWSDEGIYGRLWGPQAISWEADEKICISITGTNAQGSSCVRLYLTSLPNPAGESEGRVVMQAVRGLWIHAPEEVDPALIRFAGHSRIAKRGFPWEGEFFLRWNALSPSWRPSQSLWIHVFRIGGERPYSVLRMGPY